MTNEEAKSLIKENPDNFIKLRDIEEYGFDLDPVIKEDHTILENIDKNLLNDKSFMMEMVQINPFTLMYASEWQKMDRELVTTAMDIDTFSFSMASDALKDNENFILEYMKFVSIFDFSWLIFISSRLKNNKAFSLEIIKYDSDALKFFSDEIKDDETVVLAAASKDPGSLEYASSRLKNSRSFIYKLVKENERYSPGPLSYASRELRGDKKFVLECFHSNKDDTFMLHNITDALKDDEDFIKQAIEISGYSLSYASERLQRKKELIFEAIKQTRDLHVVDYRKNLSDDKETVIFALEHGATLAQASERLRDDDDVVKIALEANGTNFVYVSSRLQTDESLKLLAQRNARVF
jgi:predicted DNA-binding ArsR family transcriptional regulator